MLLKKFCKLFDIVCLKQHSESYDHANKNVAVLLRSRAFVYELCGWFGIVGSNPIPVTLQKCLIL